MVDWEAEHVEADVEDVVTGNWVPLLPCAVNTREVPRLNSYSYQELKLQKVRNNQVQKQVSVSANYKY